MMANIPARFQEFGVTADARAIASTPANHAREKPSSPLCARRTRNRSLEEVRHPGFGAGRNVRFGDLDGDGQLDMLFAQNIPRSAATPSITSAV